jgi:glycosyltransferase involved in cell wall biosynthesis
MREMIAAFQRAGHEVKTVIRGGELESDPQLKNRRMRGVKAILKRGIPSSFWESMKHRQRIRDDQRYEPILEQLVAELEPDIIYERAAYLQPSGINVAKTTGKLHVLEVNTPVNAERHFLGLPNSRYESLAEEIECKQLRETTLAAVVSPEMAKYFTQKYKTDPGKFVCTPNGVPAKGIAVDQGKAESLEKLFQTRGRKVVGFVGCMARWQRVDLLLEAIAILRGEFSEVLGLFVGGDTEKITSLNRKASELGIEELVKFAGSVEKRDVSAYLMNMHVCVLADNLWYGSPTKIFEYGALARPVVAPDNLTMRSVIEHPLEGLLVSADPAEIAHAIASLFRDGKRAELMASAFKRRVFREFTWDANVKKIEQALENYRH